MNEYNSKNNIKINQISLNDISLTINNWINNLKNEINLINYLESSIQSEKNNLQQKELQNILFKLKKLKIDSININKQIEDFSINYCNYSNYKKNQNIQVEDDEKFKLTIKSLNEKYSNISFKIKSFIEIFPLLIDLREKFINNQIKSFSQININKKIKNKIKNAKSFCNKNKGGLLSETKIKENTNNYLDENEKRIKIDILKERIKNIQINFDQSQSDLNERTFNLYNKNNITPSNKYIKEFKHNSFIKNYNTSNSSCREGFLIIPKKKCFIKKFKNNENEIISNQNFHIHNSCNNSSINLNIINHNNKNNLSNRSNINKIIPNNFRHDYKNIQINSFENNKNINTNPNIIKEYKIKGLKIKNNKKLNFPIKNILYEQKTIKNKNLKANIILKDKYKINNNNYWNNTPKYLDKKQNKDNNKNGYSKILYTKPLNNNKRSNSEYFLNPIKMEICSSKSNNNSLNYREKKIRGFSLENFDINKLGIQNENTTRIIKRKEKIKNRAINAFNDNKSRKEIPVYNRNMSFTFSNKNAIDNNLLENENLDNNDKIIFDNDIFMNIKEKNNKLESEIYFLKKEIENISLMCKNLSFKVINLEEQNELLKKENKEILKLLNIYKK